jgi:hypothetical protein
MTLISQKKSLIKYVDVDLLSCDDVWSVDL